VTATDPISVASPICDAHVHFWDPTVHYYPWLCDEPLIPFRYGDYSAIRRRYLPSDYLKDARRFAVVKTVYVEAEWDSHDPVGEMRYVETLRANTGFPTVAVAQAWLDRVDCTVVLEQQAAFSFVRSVRHKPRANRSPRDTVPGGMTDTVWRRGFSFLARHGLRFDLQTPWWHLHEAAQLAAQFPNTQIILNHTGLPVDRSPAGLAGWRAAMAKAAAAPNIAVKISGLGVPGARWTAAANRDIVLATIDLFGPARAMFASNFPVDSLCGTFGAIYAGFHTIVRGFSPDEQRALFHDNAVRIYGIKESST
jgi:predicted TIM-barrel fold metal-dependent hydrolase